jgi:cytochrome b561
MAAKSAARKQLWFLHWAMAAVFVLLFTVGLIMVNLPEGNGVAGSLYSFHKSLGVLVMFLLTARILTVLRAIVPGRARNWLATAALHSALYLFMVVVPVSGYFYSNSSGHGVAFFGLPMPTLFAKNKAVADLAGDLHGWLAYTFLCFVAVHLVAQRRYIAGLSKRLWRFAKAP